MTFSNRQRQVIGFARSDRMGMVAVGAIRSGKTYAVGVSFAAWVLSEAGPDYDHALIGQTVDSAMRNMGFDLVDIFNSFGCRAYIDRRFGTRIVCPIPGREVSIWVWGGYDNRARKRIQGITLKGLVIDESALVPEDLFMMAWGRLSADKAKWWATCNPENPAHWFRKKVVDAQEQFDCDILHFKMDDNPSLSEEVKDRYKNAFSGHFKQRYIEGLWVGASGLIYTAWRIGAEPEPENVNKYVAAIDYGRASTFCGLMFAEQDRGVTAVGELYHDAAESVTLTDNQILERFKEWRLRWLTESQSLTIYLDPATPLTFKRMLRRDGFIVRNSQNTVVDGIITTGARLESGDLKIGKDCPKLQEELGAYQWDEKALERGEEAPLKQMDHACDALRYYAHTTGRLRRFAA